jgi:nucleoside-diphosphate-sugar epimerase
MIGNIKRALVTGGAGFIGSNLVDALLKNGVSVSILDNLSTGKLANLEHVLERVTFEKGDIRDFDRVRRLADGCDAVFHQAAVVSVPQTVAEPLTSAEINDLGTLNVLEASRQAGVESVVLASSCAVYGDDPALPKKESMPLKPQSPYAVQKYTNELNAELYRTLYGLKTTCLRYFNVYGPRQDPSSPYSGVISIFLTKASRKETPLIYGDGQQYRDFVFVQDVVKANLLAAGAGEDTGGVYNIGTGAFVTINDLWKRIAVLNRTGKMPRHLAPRAGDIRESVADIGLAKRRLGYAAGYTFEEGLQLTYEWYKKN